MVLANTASKEVISIWFSDPYYTICWHFSRRPLVFHCVFLFRVLLLYRPTQHRVNLKSMLQEVRGDVNGWQSYDAKLVAEGDVDENGSAVRLHEGDLDRIQLARLKLNVLDMAPAGRVVIWLRVRVALFISRKKGNDK